jgi:hypothetical protein
MHEGVLNFVYVIRISVMSESTETRSIEVDSQRLISGYKDINTHVKLLATNKQWIHDIPLHNIRFSLRTFRLPPKIVFPLRDLS